MSRWIATSEHTLAEVVPAAPERVKDFYVELDNLGSFHPFVVGIQSLRRTEATGGYRHLYRVREKIPIGPVRLTISFPTSLLVPDDGDVTSEVRQFPLVRLHNTVAFEPAADGTRIVERLRVSAPRPLAGFTARQAIAAHTRVLAGIRAHFESAG